jgi:hypothetical protein
MAGEHDDVDVGSAQEAREHRQPVHADPHRLLPAVVRVEREHEHEVEGVQPGAPQRRLDTAQDAIAAVVEAPDGAQPASRNPVAVTTALAPSPPHPAEGAGRVPIGAYVAEVTVDRQTGVSAWRRSRWGSPGAPAGTAHRDTAAAPAETLSPSTGPAPRIRFSSAIGSSGPTTPRHATWPSGRTSTSGAS